MKFGTDEQKERTCRRWRRASCARPSRCPSPSWAPTSRRSRRARPRRRRRVRDQRPEDVGHQRPPGRPRLHAGQDRQGRRPALQGHDLLHLREGAGRARRARGDHKGFNVPPKIKKMGYKGVESTELVFDGYRCPAENILGGEDAGLGQGFVQMMDALEVGRVNVAARGVGHRPARAGAGAALLAGAQDLRQADRRAPGDPVQAGRHGDQGRRGAPAHPARRAPEGRRRALRPRGRDGQAVRLGGRHGSASRTPSASTAATATPRSTRSSACTATRRCC